MAEDLGPDPLAPWLREIAATHDAARHTAGSQCRGSVALIDEAARLRGVAEVRLGRAISLEREVETRPAQLARLAEAAAEERRAWQALAQAELPDGHGAVELDVRVGLYGRSAHGGDVITYDAHGVHNTHLDGLAHLGTDATWHGPIPVANSQTDEDTIVNWAQHGIATRGVLLDIPAIRGTEWVTADQPVTGDDLDAALKATGVTLAPGDALIIYQGRDRFEAAGHRYTPGAVFQARPGIGADGAAWIAANDPGLVLWDFHDARSNPMFALEVHSLIYAIGLCLIDNSLLGPAAAALRAAGTSTGLLVAAPTAIHRSTGVLINPLLLY
ncbi:cyclase family protein [Actinoplanes palleronii]|nr:cyclase family protein [Actinoplanes palleronii]